MLRIVLVLLLILVLSSIIFSLPVVQTKIAKRATDSLNAEFGTNINIDRVQFSPFTLGAIVKDIYVEDYQKDTLFFIKKLSTSVLSIRNMMNGQLEFGDIDVDELLFKMKTYKGETDTNLDKFVAKLDDGQPRAPGTPPFFMSSTEINLNDSKFYLIDENLENTDVLRFRDLKVKATDFQILGPEVGMSINNLSLRSRRNLRLEKLTTEFKYTKQQMRFDSLYINTQESILKGNLQFNYNREDFSDFLNKVNVKANFEESTVAFNEINAYFNEFGTDKTANFSSTIDGVLNDLLVTDLILLSDNTGVRGDFNFRNLFKEEEPFIMVAKMDNVTSSYYQLRGLLPNILGKSIPTSFQKLGQFTVRGDAEVTDSSVDVQVNLNTAIGSSYSDLQMTNINNIDDASYRGFISLIDFDLGEFIDNPKFGKTSLDVNVEGRGFIAEYLNTEAIGEVYSIDFNNYTYKGLKLSGIIKEELFDGSLISTDENCKFDFKGLADFSEERSDFNFIANVDYADFKRLNFISDTISIFKGNVKMDIAGNSLDNITGDVKFENTIYQNKNNTYNFDDFAISSTFENDSLRNIQIISPDIITGYMKGNFRIAELGKLFQNSLGSIYTNYKPFEISNGQEIAFNFKIYNKIISIFLPEVNFGPDTFIRGNIVADEGDFKLTFKSPAIEAYKNEFENIELKIDNKNPLFNTFLAVDNMKTVYYDLKDFNLINTTLKDTLFFRTEFKGGSQFNDSYNLNFYHTFNQDNKSVIGLKRSEINFKGNNWVLNKTGNRQNKVIVNRTLDSIQIREIVMDNGKDEQIRLKGQLADSTYKDLELQFKIVSLNKITPAIDSLKLDGQVNGFLNILQKDGKYLPSSSLDINDFSVNDLHMGDMEVVVFGNNDLSEFGVNSWLTDNGQEKFSVSGKINNSKTETTLDLLASLNDFKLEPFAPLGEDIISNIRGFLSGNVRVTGDVNSPNFNGTLSMDEAGLGISYLNVDYDFAPLSRVRLFDQTFYFDNIVLNDVTFDTKATLDGTITHNAFSDWNLGLNLSTNNDRFLILNTDFDEDELYYGTGFVNGTGSIFGSTNALNIEFDGASARGTQLKIPLSDVTSIGDYSFINFIEKDESNVVVGERVLDNYQGLELAFDLAVTPDAEVEIVVDRESGSTLKGTGEGLLLFEINTNGKFNMFGEFVVVTGEYRFRRAGLIDKTFTVRPGGTILWERDPLEAELNLEAVYKLNANPAPLLDNPNYARRIPTEVVVRLDGELESPTIDFNIEFPGTNSVIKSELEYLLQDPTIESNNAFFLLAQGTFVNNQTTGLNQQAVTGNLIQTASGLLNQVLGGNDGKFNFGLSYEQGYEDVNAGINTEDRIGVTVSTQISDRVLVNGRVGVPVGGATETVIAGDVEIQVLLNEDGTLSAKFFNRQGEIQQFLAEQGNNNTQGIGLSYQVDFNNFNELMNKIFKSKKKEELPEVEPELNSNVMGKDSLIRFYTKKNTFKE
ncbi:translocation/assembly module TamB domain-containing protein [Croceitalea rosinachiae]|uniref:Translocation/assembly module TamB domain-containing protein n=1 Tax=Croceitalea rosinachiae TaxID=3075596 RepID=A0ABU3AHS0_9FLAO|nr:translocation/assembly module TamB domain-containing protein [Croceitalea sp. F388]MDT0608446.1 translocation/assembly module TamB domain-containing protein [Croceitalea sp. F388]